MSVTLLRVCLLLMVLHEISSSLLIKVEPGRSRCFEEDLFEGNMLMIKWKIFTASKSDISQQISNFIIFILNSDTKEQVFSVTPTSYKEKAQFNPPRDGLYRVCAILRANYKEKEPIYINFKFGNDFNAEPELDKAIQSKDVDNLEVKSRNVIELAKPIIEKQKSELELERGNAESTIKSTRWYKYLTFVQIAVCLIIGLVQVNNFLRFLKSQNII